jgi:outer membrane protein assembly factor BamA
MLAVLSLFPVTVLAQEEDQELKGFQVTGIPLIDYNRSTELKLGALAMGFFPMSKADTVSPTSSVGLGGFYTTNKTWAGGAFAQLYWSEDTYRLLSAIGVGSLNFQFYDDEIAPGAAIGFNTGARAFYGEISRRVVSHFYAGVLIAISNVRTVLDIDGVAADTARQWINGWGIPLQWDTRDNQYNATSGVYSVARTIFNQEWLGSDFEYTGVNFSINGYQRLTEKGVLAGRFDAFVGLGDVPFEGQRVVGRDDIRGYTKGEWRGEQVYSTQAEYRHNIAGRFGGVAFAGLALAVNPDDEDPTSPLLPGAGVGVRFMTIPDYQINIGVDVAVGKDDWGLYFRIGEAF